MSGRPGVDRFVPLDVDVDESVMRTIVAVSEAEDIDHAEVVNRAVRLYAALVRRRAAGERVWVGAAYAFAEEWTAWE